METRRQTGLKFELYFLICEILYTIHDFDYPDPVSSMQNASNDIKVLGGVERRLISLSDLTTNGSYLA